MGDSMSKLQVETISHTNNTSALTIDSSGNVTAPVSIGNAGSIVQVVQTRTDSGISTASTSYAATGLALAITPKFSTSKLKVMVLGGRNYYQSDSVPVSYTHLTLPTILLV